MTLQISRMPGATPAATPAEPTPAPGAPAEPVPAAPPTTVNVQVTSGAAPEKQMDEFLVVMVDQANDKVAKAFSMPTGLKRREYVAQTLIDNMMKTQAPVWKALDGLQAAGHIESYQPLWIENAIVVKGDADARTQMANGFGGVASMQDSQVHTVANPATAEAMGESIKPPRGGFQGAQWNLDRLDVEDAWKNGLTGKGVTVGSIDTGVDVTHPALLTNFRGYDARTGTVDVTGNWFDATGESPNAMVDEGRHGTHTTGTAVGTDGRDNKIGVAPDATWFAARGLGEQGGTDGMLLKSFQFMAAPRVPTPGVSPGTRRDLSLGADVNNNSWGSDDGLSTSYLSALRNMAAMGIVNVFAAGNDGGGNGSLGSPASSPYVISVAATDRKDKVADFSSRGPNPLPAIDGEPAPFVGAPGVDIRSSVPGGGYESGWQGTSMATPAITGLVALAQQAALEETGHELDVVAMKDVLKAAAQDVGPKGVDTGTGYGIPTADNLRKIVLDVATARGLVDAKAGAKAATKKAAA
jgi:bacillopeptidase F